MFRQLTSRVTPLARSLLDSNALWDVEQLRSFGILSEYNTRSNKKITGTHLMPERHSFFVTSARPGNFGEHLDFKSTIDNWFDENR